jgi:hypothetical protein
MLSLFFGGCFAIKEMRIANRHEPCIGLPEEPLSTCFLCNGEEHNDVYEGSKWTFELEALLDDQDPEATSNPNLSCE